MALLKILFKSRTVNKRDEKKSQSKDKKMKLWKSNIQVISSERKTLLFNIILGVLPKPIRQEKEIRHKSWKGRDQIFFLCREYNDLYSKREKMKEREEKEVGD